MKVHHSCSKVHVLQSVLQMLQPIIMFVNVNRDLYLPMDNVPHLVIQTCYSNLQIVEIKDFTTQLPEDVLNVINLALPVMDHQAITV